MQKVYLTMHIIWSSEFNQNQVEVNIKNEYKEEFEYGVYSESDMPRLIEQYKQDKLDGVRRKYKRTLEGNLIVVADIERWTKRHTTVAFLNTHDIEGIFKTLDDGTDIRWYWDNHNVRGDEVTKSGVNHYIFREVRDNKNITKLKQRLQKGEQVTPQLLNYYTKTILPHFLEEV